MDLFIVIVQTQQSSNIRFKPTFLEEKQKKKNWRLNPAIIIYQTSIYMTDNSLRDNMFFVTD